MGNPFDQFDEAPARSSPAQGNPFDQFDAPAKPGVAMDVAKSIPSGFARGVAGIVGLPDLADQGASYVYDHTAGRIANAMRTGSFAAPTEGSYDRVRRMRAESGLPMISSPTAKQVVGAIEGVTGPLYKPQTMAGEYAGTAAEFAAGLPFTGGSALQRGAQILVPAVTSETAGQVTKGTAIEPYARAAGGVLGGVATAIAQAPRGVAPVLEKSLAGIDAQTMARAEQVFAEGQRQGVNLTWFEAIDKASNGATRLGDVMRVVENSAGGGEVMRPFFAQRAGQVEAAGGKAIGGLADNALDPVTTGIRVQGAAEGVIGDTQKAINAATRPAYQAAENVRLPPQEFQKIAADPLFLKTLKEVRADPALNRTIAQLPNDAVGTVDLVIRRMDEVARAARVPGQASTSNLVAMNLDDASAPALRAAEAAAPSYATANQAQRQLRANNLEPLTRGPVGKIAAKEDVIEQGRALLPASPASGSDVAVAQAVRGMVRKDPDAAANLARIHLQTVFDEATQALASGPNQFGGAKFAAIVNGNSQQARNLSAMIQSLPDGQNRLAGFKTFLDVLEATGTRRQAGSQTAFNQTIQEQLRGGGVGSEIGKAVATGGTSLATAPGRLAQWWNELKIGKNTEALARIATDPASAILLRELAKSPSGGAKAAMLAARLTYVASEPFAKANANNRPVNQ